MQNFDFSYWLSNLGLLVYVRLGYHTFASLCEACVYLVYIFNLQDVY